MLTVKIHTDGTGQTLSMAGHAGAGKRGTDLVCAAASMLAYTAAAFARQLYREGALKKPPRIRLEPGLARVELTDRGTAGEQLMATVQTGFSLLAAQYPEHVKLEEI